MDANDNKEIHEELDNIKENSKLLNDNFQKQEIFNNEILTQFENIKDHINNRANFNKPILWKLRKPNLQTIELAWYPSGGNAVFKQN